MSSGGAAARANRSPEATCAPPAGVTLSVPLEAPMFDVLFKFDPFSQRALSAKTSLASLVLRLGLAAIFIYHGQDKIFGLGNEWGAAWAGKMVLKAHEIEAPSLQSHAVQLLVAWGEFLGGIALALGLLTRLAALGEMIIQVGAVYRYPSHRG